MAACVVPGTANPALALAVARHLGSDLAPCAVERFPDGELRPTVEGVRGQDVYVVQPTGPPVSESLVELLLLVDACRRAGAARVTAVVPYFGYARQDRRIHEGQALGARVCADALVASGAERLVVVDPHSAALEAMCAVPVELLTAVPTMARAIESTLRATAVVVSPDLGAVKLAERYAAGTRRDVAVVRKSRVSGRAVHASELIGEVSGHAVVVVDDMISTGATIEAAVGLLRSRGCTDVAVAATHAVFARGATGRLGALRAERVVVSDTLALSAEAAPPVRSSGNGALVGLEVCSVAPLLAEAVGRLHRDLPLDELRLAV